MQKVEPSLMTSCYENILDQAMSWRVTRKKIQEFMALDDFKKRLRSKLRNRIFFFLKEIHGFMSKYTKRLLSFCEPCKTLSKTSFYVYNYYFSNVNLVFI